MYWGGGQWEPDSEHRCVSLHMAWILSLRMRNLVKESNKEQRHDQMCTGEVRLYVCMVGRETGMSILEYSLKIVTIISEGLMNDSGD